MLSEGSSRSSCYTQIGKLERWEVKKVKAMRTEVLRKGRTGKKSDFRPHIYPNGVQNFSSYIIHSTAILLQTPDGYCLSSGGGDIVYFQRYTIDTAQIQFVEPRIAVLYTLQFFMLFVFMMPCIADLY
jgi:hypothetical protein